jgi:AcrR family transcriptional regulator
MLTGIGRRGRGRPRDTSIETAVVEASIAEIAEKGLDATTMEGIADRSGVSKATLYRRWPNKTAVLYFLADRLVDVIEPADTGDLRKDLLTVFEPLAEQSYGDGPVALLAPTFIAAAAHDPQMRAFVQDQVASRRAGAIKALRRAQRRGELRRGVDITLTVEMIAGALSERAYLLGKPVTSTYVRRIIDQAIMGVVVNRRS